MAVWDDRYRYGEHEPDRSYGGVPTNPPFDLVGGLRNVTTLKGVLPFGSIDPRAVDYGQPVSTLARGAYDGQQVRYRHTNGEAPWLCIWDSALNSGAGAWAVIGGPPLRARVDTLQATTSTSFVELATTGPAVNIVATGVYVVQVGAFCRPNTAGPFTAIMGFAAPGISAADADAAHGISTSAGDGASAVSPPVVATVTSLGSFSARYRSTTGASAQFARRWLTAMPIELRP